MLHPRKVLRALSGSAKRKLRILSGLKARPKSPVLDQGIARVVERNTKLCGTLQQLIGPEVALTGAMACEVGPGDCLATGALVLGLGAAHVDLVEHQPPFVNSMQLEALTALKNKGFPVELSIIRHKGNSYELNPDKATYHKVYMEDYSAADMYVLIFSLNVGEHVEDLGRFFSSCYRATAPGGYNLHMIDLGGHGELEDPTPPLDFQTYPDWLFNIMYPPFYRATRRFVSEYTAAATKAGFIVEKICELRIVEDIYLQEIRPKLRTGATGIPDDELRVIEFGLQARKPR